MPSRTSANRWWFAARVSWTWRSSCAPDAAIAGSTRGIRPPVAGCAPPRNHSCAGEHLVEPDAEHGDSGPDPGTNSDDGEPDQGDQPGEGAAIVTHVDQPPPR